MRNKKRIISFFKDRISPLLLAAVMILSSIFNTMLLGGAMFPTITHAEEGGIEDEMALEGSTVRDDALHFLIRHWHTGVDYETTFNGDDDDGNPETDRDVFQTEAATQSYFVLIEGYILPIKDAEGDEEKFSIYIVDQTSQTLKSVFKVDEAGNYEKDEKGEKIIATSYITEVNTKEGTVSIRVKPLKVDGDEVEVFSGFSVSTGRSSITTNVDDDGVIESVTVHYDEYTRLAKGHIFYTQKRKTVPGISDPAVFPADLSELDVKSVYAYDLGNENNATVKCGSEFHKTTDNGEIVEVSHQNGEIVKYITEEVVDGETVKVDHVCTNDDELCAAKDKGEPVEWECVKDEEGEGEGEGDPNTPVKDGDGNILWTNVKLTKFYSTNEGLHTDKTLMQAADGRIFLFDLQTWYTEGYAAQLSFLIDASGSMLFAFDKPVTMNIYGVLAEKLGAVKRTKSTDTSAGVNTTYEWTYTANSGDIISFPATDTNAAKKLKDLFEQILKDIDAVETNVASDAEVKYTGDDNNVKYDVLAEALTKATGTKIDEKNLSALFGKIGAVSGLDNTSAASWEENVFLDDALLSILLNPRNTDNRSLGTNGYSYYVYSGGNDNAYVPLGYWEGTNTIADDISYKFEKDEEEDVVTGWPKRDDNQQDLISMSTATGYRLTASPRGIVLDAQPKSGTFTISFRLRTDSATDYNKMKEILYIGPMSGETKEGGYYRLFRGEGTTTLRAISHSGVIDYVTEINDVFKANNTEGTVITLVFNGKEVTSYKDGNEMNTKVDFGGFTNGENKEDINIIINGIEDSYTGREIAIDDIYVFDEALSGENVKTIASVKDGNINKEFEKYSALIGMYTFTNESQKPLKGDDKSRTWMKNSAPDTKNNTKHEDSDFVDNKGSAYAYALKEKRSFGKTTTVGSREATWVSGTTSYTSLVAQTRAGIDLGSVDDGTGYGENLAKGMGAGWYFVTHVGYVSHYTAVGTGKRLQGIQSGVEFTDGKTYKTESNSATKFYIDGSGNLKCFYTKGGTSYVYQLEDSQYSRVEAAQRILANFSTKFSDLSPTSYLSAVRFSATDYNSSNNDQQVLLDWSSDPTEAAAIMSNTRGSITYDEETGEEIDTIGSALGHTTSPSGTDQYNYVLTGSTDTFKGLAAYAQRLHGVTEVTGVTNKEDYDYKLADEKGTTRYYKLTGSKLKDNDAPKFIVIFTDGANTGSTDDAKELANALKNVGYTIVGVLFAGDSMSADDQKKAETFFSSVVGTNEDNTLSRYYFRASDLTKLITLFNDQIMAQMIDSLTGYTIQDYIDPRFDLQQGDGSLWELGAGGEVVVEGVLKTDNEGKTYSSLDDVTKKLKDAGFNEAKSDTVAQGTYKYVTKPDVKNKVAGSLKFSVIGGAPFHIYDAVVRAATTNSTKDEETGEETVEVTDKGQFPDLEGEDLSDITTSARDPYLYYDSLKDMYYLQWVNQTLPTSQVGSITLMPVWSVTVLLSAKEDFIGGNAILTDGNDAFMNWVYHPLDLDVGTEQDLLNGNLTAQQERNLAEQEAYIELRIDQYQDNHSVLNPTITEDEYVQAHLAEYLWEYFTGDLSKRLNDDLKKLSENLSDELKKVEEQLKNLDQSSEEYKTLSAAKTQLEALQKKVNGELKEQFEKLPNELQQLIKLTEEQKKDIKDKVTTALEKKFAIIEKSKNYYPSFKKTDYIARDQAQYLYEHLAEYLSEFSEEELQAILGKSTSDNSSDDKLTTEQIVEKVISEITEKLKNVLKAEYEPRKGANDELEATQDEYVTLKLAENTSKKTDHDASSGTTDMTKIYYPEMIKDKDGNVLYDKDGNVRYQDGKSNDENEKEITFEHFEDGTIRVTRKSTGEELTTADYERDWDNVIDARVSKGFTRATVNVQLLQIDVSSKYSVVYMGEVISPAQLLADIEGDIITDSYYLEYLKRYAYQRYLYTVNPDEANMPLLDLFNNWLQFESKEDYEKSFSIPYMYLPSVAYGKDGYLEMDKVTGNVKIQNSSGFSTPVVDEKGVPIVNEDGTITISNKAFDNSDGILADVVGILTYRWEMIEPDAKEDLKDPTAATKNYVKDDTERVRYAVTIGFTPLREGDVLGTQDEKKNWTGGYWIDSKTGERYSSDPSAKDNDSETGEPYDDEPSADENTEGKYIYIPSLNESDDDGKEIFAGYLPIRASYNSTKWDWGSQEHRYGDDSKAANFVFDREKLVNGYTDEEGKFHTGYIKETAEIIVKSSGDEGVETETKTKTKTVFGWNPAYKPAVYHQQLVNATNEYTNTDDTVQLINRGQMVEIKGEDDSVTEVRKFANDPRTIKGYSVYAINVVSGDIVLEFELQTGELKQLLTGYEDKEDYTDKEAKTVVLNYIFTVEAKRSFTDTEFTEKQKKEEHLSDYGDTFTITFKLSYTQAEINAVLEKAKENYGYASVYAKATKVEGEWYERTPGNPNENVIARQVTVEEGSVIAKPVTDEEGGVYYEVKSTKVIYEQLPIGSYKFELKDVKLQDDNAQGDNTQGDNTQGDNTQDVETLFLNGIQFSVMAGEGQRDASKYKDAYNYFSDVVLNGLHTYSEKTACTDDEGNTQYKYEPKLAQRRYDETGKLVYITDPKASPVDEDAKGKGYTEGKDESGNKAWLNGETVVYWYDENETTWYYGDEGEGTDTGKGKVFYKYDEKNLTWSNAAGEVVYRYDSRLEVWRGADGFRIPYYWKEAQMREITEDDVKNSDANNAVYESRGIANYIADSETAKDSTQVTFYMGTDGGNFKDSYDRYYPGERVGIIALSTGTVKLTIHEEGGKSNESFLYRIHGTTLGDQPVDFTVSVKGGSLTMINIAAGNYTVEEISNWSWRYKDGVVDTSTHAPTPEGAWSEYTGGASAKLQLTTTTGVKYDGDKKPIAGSTDAHAEIWFTHERNDKTWVGGEWSSDPEKEQVAG